MDRADLQEDSRTVKRGGVDETKKYNIPYEKSKSIYLVDTPEKIQWIGNGAVMYPLMGMPYMTKEQIFTWFEVKEEKQNDFYFKHTEAASNMYENVLSDEEQVQLEKIGLEINGSSLGIIDTGDEVFCINKKYLSPTIDLEEWAIYKRGSGKGTYFVIKSGFLNYGIIMPAILKYDYLDEFAEKIKKLISDDDKPLPQMEMEI